MIGTVEIKQQQLTNTYFKVGSGEEKILVMGSCRVCPYVSYLNNWNNKNGNRFTIFSIDPFNWNWNRWDERTDYAQALFELEYDDRLLSMLESVDYFLHEYYKNSGMFNVVKEEAKNIYNFGLLPKMDICIPSWNDVFVLFKDIFSFDLEIRKKGIQDINVTGKLSVQTQKEIYEVSRRNLQKFYFVCSLSGIPEMEDYFRYNFAKKRMWHTYNHTNKNFTMAVFNLINEKYLHLSLPDDFYSDQEDIFANSFTPLTQYDVDYYGYEWQEEIKSIL